MRKLLFVLACGLAFGWVPALTPLVAADQTILKIVVTNETGKPVDNANVVVKFVSGRSKAKLGVKIRTEWDMRTSQEGIAKIPSIPQGKILIQVIAKNYQTFGQTFDVDQDEKTVEVKLKPPQPQYSAH
jgi:uncharacterized GH25 family protein